jgi:putative protease
MPYELIADGKQVPLGDRKYLLSPQDLAGLEMLPDLARAGVFSFKIEGRLKSPEYVANISRIYRKALNDLLEPQSPITNHPSLAANYDMQMAFSRGLYTGWLGGINNQQLVHARFGKKRGVYLGEVVRVERDHVFLNLEGHLKRGDGIVFDAGKPEGEEEGGRVYDIQVQNGTATLSFGRGDLNFDRINPGDKVWKTSDPELDRRLRQSFAGEQPHFQRELRMEVHGRAAEPLVLICRDELGHVVQARSAMPLEEARQQPLNTERLCEQLGRLGGTPFKLGELKNLLEGDVLLPLSELNKLRRQTVIELEDLRAQPKRWTLGSGARVKGPRLTPETVKKARLNAPQLVVLVRNMAQLEAALNCGVETLYCEFEDPKKYRDAVSQFRARPRNHSESTKESGPSIWVAPPRIFKMGEEWTLKQVRSCEADGYLVRNYDHLNFFAGDRRIGDFSLNIANRLSAEYFMEAFGLERITASYDLNAAQFEVLLQGSPPEWFEITIHQHMPMFHMEHCVFCAFLSDGTDYTNCGRPCDTRNLKLRDRVGAEHPVKADVGCRNTVFNALAQTGAEHVLRMLALGVRYFRIEFVNETPDQVTRTISKYRQLLLGEITGPQLWRELKLQNQLGVTRGPERG